MYEDYMFKRIKDLDKKESGEYQALGLRITKAMSDLIEWEIRKGIERARTQGEYKLIKRSLIGMTMAWYQENIGALGKTLPAIIADMLERFKEDIE